MGWLGSHGYSYTSLTEDLLTIWKGPAILFVIIKPECEEYVKIYQVSFSFSLFLSERQSWKNSIRSRGCVQKAWQSENGIQKPWQSENVK